MSTRQLGPMARAGIYLQIRKESLHPYIHCRVHFMLQSAVCPATVKMKSAILISLLSLVLLPLEVSAFSSGAPPSTCETLLPSADAHEAEPQTTDVPYKLDISSLAATVGGTEGYGYEPGKHSLLSLFR